MDYLYNQIPGFCIDLTTRAEKLEDNFSGSLCTLNLTEWMNFYRFLRNTPHTRFHMGYTFSVLHPDLYKGDINVAPALDNGYPPECCVADIVGHYALFKGLTYKPSKKTTIPSFDFEVPGYEPDPHYTKLAWYFGDQMRIDRELSLFITYGRFAPHDYYLIQHKDALRYLHLVACLAELYQKPKAIAQPKATA